MVHRVVEYRKGAVERCLLRSARNAHRVILLCRLRKSESDNRSAWPPRVKAFLASGVARPKVPVWGLWAFDEVSRNVELARISVIVSVGVVQALMVELTVHTHLLGRLRILYSV